VGLNVLYAEVTDYDAAFEEKKRLCSGKHCIIDARTSADLLAEALKIANQSDVILAALGESAEMSGESSSRTNLEILKQKDLLQALLKKGKPVVLVLFTGRPLVLVEETKQIPAILNTWFWVAKLEVQ
jgi:beta-glucosidase